MLKYLILDLVFLAFVLAAHLSVPRHHRIGSYMGLLLIMLLLTAVFDNLIIMAGIVAYDPATILGWYIGRAPIEDFAYAIAAVYLMPAIWHRLERRV